MKDWNELTRAEKVEHFFDYPEETRQDRVKELWGEEAHQYMMHIYFPLNTPWDEIVTITKLTKGQSQSIYLTLAADDFQIYEAAADSLTSEGKLDRYQLRKWEERITFQAWCVRTIRDKQPIRAELKWNKESQLVANVCIEEGGYGDDDGFGVEPTVWGSAILDETGKIICPFSLGYIW